MYYRYGKGIGSDGDLCRVAAEANCAVPDPAVRGSSVAERPATMARGGAGRGRGGGWAG